MHSWKLGLEGLYFRLRGANDTPGFLRTGFLGSQRRLFCATEAAAMEGQCLGPLAGYISQSRASHDDWETARTKRRGQQPQRPRERSGFGRLSDMRKAAASLALLRRTLSIQSLLLPERTGDRADMACDQIVVPSGCLPTGVGVTGTATVTARCHHGGSGERVKGGS